MANGKGSKRRPSAKPGLYEENYAQIKWRKSQQTWADVCEYADSLPKTPVYFDLPDAKPAQRQTPPCR